MMSKKCGCRGDEKRGGERDREKDLRGKKKGLEEKKNRGWGG